MTLYLPFPGKTYSFHLSQGVRDLKSEKGYFTHGILNTNLSCKACVHVLFSDAEAFPETRHTII